MRYDPGRARELLRVGSGWPQADFRDGQEHAIRHLVEGRGRLLVVQKTSWGKSFVYFIATRLPREQGRGPALLVSPLLSLMRNKIEAAARMGVRAATINLDNQDGWSAVEAQIRRDEVNILPSGWGTRHSSATCSPRCRAGSPCWSSTKPTASPIGVLLPAPLLTP